MKRIIDIKELKACMIEIAQGMGTEIPSLTKELFSCINFD